MGKNAARWNALFGKKAEAAKATRQRGASIAKVAKQFNVTEKWVKENCPAPDTVPADQPDPDPTPDGGTGIPGVTST